jgi:tetratricopeptide (TPR) repeat protein
MAPIIRLTKVLLATFVASIVIALPSTARAQKFDPGKALGQTPESGSLPLSSKVGADARQELGQVARNYERGVFFVGNPKVATGTAWVISKKHRLLVTNAHVGDIWHDAGGKMVAIASGSGQIYSVTRVWYHPGVRRLLKNNPNLSVRSMDPKEGDVDARSPDLGLLQLAPDGPELPVEFALATAEEMASLFAQPVAIVGFPGHDNKSWPALGDKVAATYHDGVVQRVTDFLLNPSVPAHELQFVQYSMSTWGGFSGSPVFLPNGHVAAVHNMARTEKHGEVVKAIPHGIRADCVLELLVHHGLDDKVSFTIDKSRVRIDRWLKHDARSEKARADLAKAVTLVADAEYLVYVKQDYLKGVAKCEEALKLAPNYAWAYSVRGGAFTNARFDRRDQLSDKNQLQLAKWALADALKAAQLEPSNSDYLLNVCCAFNNLGVVTGDTTFNERVLGVVNEFLTIDNLSPALRGTAMNRRGVAYDNLGDLKSAWRDHNEAVRLCPEEPSHLETRAAFLEGRGLGDLGRSDWARARKLRAKQLETGLKITKVMDGSAALVAGLRAGDVIVSAGANRVRTFEDFTTAMAAANGPVTLEIIRAEGNNRETISVTPVAGKIGVIIERVELN